MRFTKPMGILAAAAAVFTTVAAAPNVVVAQDKEPPSVALSNAFLGNAWRRSMITAFEEAATKAQEDGLISSFQVSNAPGENSATEQIAQLKALLLDEPFGALDALTRGTIQDELLKIWGGTEQTVFMITHDIDEAILLADRILLMSNGPFARVAESVEITIPRPRNRTAIVEHPNYYAIRNHLVQFLGRRSRELSGTASDGAPQSPTPVRIDKTTPSDDDEPRLRAVNV